jgi:hypothetical protein
MSNVWFENEKGRLLTKGTREDRRLTDMTIINYLFSIYVLEISQKAVVFNTFLYTVSK